MPSFLHVALVLAAVQALAHAVTALQATVAMLADKAAPRPKMGARPMFWPPLPGALPTLLVLSWWEPGGGGGANVCAHLIRQVAGQQGGAPGRGGHQRSCCRPRLCVRRRRPPFFFSVFAMNELNQRPETAWFI